MKKKSSILKVLFYLILFICIALLIEAGILQVNNTRQVSRTSHILLNETERIIMDNEQSESDILASLKDEYIQSTRTAAYILEKDTSLIDNTEELRAITEMMGIDEIHIFDESGTIYAGTVPAYYGYSFDSGEQMAFFKPLLSDKSLAMCQDVTPNTAEDKSMMYSAAWNKSGTFIVQLGIEPVRLIKEFNNNRISEVISKIPSYDGTTILIADLSTGEILGSSDKAQTGQTVYDIGILSEKDDLSRIQQNTITLGGFRHICSYSRYHEYLIAVVHSTKQISIISCQPC